MGWGGVGIIPPMSLAQLHDLRGMLLAMLLDLHLRIMVLLELLELLELLLLELLLGWVKTQMEPDLVC